jgi:hypothetical protein
MVAERHIDRGSAGFLALEVGQAHSGWALSGLPWLHLPVALAHVYHGKARQGRSHPPEIASVDASSCGFAA